MENQNKETDKMAFSTATYQNKKEHYSDQDLRDLFDAFGRSGPKGTTLTKDLRLCFNCLGLNPKESELKETMALLKRDNEENIVDTEDFLQLARAKLGPDEPMSEAELREAFAMFDQDGSGSIDPDELRQILAGAALDDEQIEQLVHDADVDGDGEIDFDEFYQLFQTMMGT